MTVTELRDAAVQIAFQRVASHMHDPMLLVRAMRAEAELVAARPKSNATREDFENWAAILQRTAIRIENTQNRKVVAREERDAQFDRAVREADAWEGGPVSPMARAILRHDLGLDDAS